jgi:hypothetical protein
MNLKQQIENILEGQQRTLGWLAGEMDKTLEGFKLSLTNESIKYADLKKLISILNVPIQTLFADNVNVQIQKGKHNTQANHSWLVHEPDVEYKKRQVEHLEKQVGQLEARIRASFLTGNRYLLKVAGLISKFGNTG